MRLAGGGTTRRAFLHFNPRTREGCDHVRPSKDAYYLDFNPRTREGCDDNQSRIQYAGISYFNPRTREGCDGDIKDIQAHEVYISIHAPVKGATIRYELNVRCDMLFQSTHP